MATSGMFTDGTPNFGSTDILDTVKSLYPQVNEAEDPLPRAWSSQDKYNYIGLSQNNLRVHYKGFGKTHKDAASVKATHPIPPSCGIYYYEVKIVSKGRDGYMGIGLSTQGVNMNRLPGWDKNSYGYHGDDGHSFCSSGTGQPYGPTFTTGDVIGCGVNLVDNNCFYTKNGDYLGIAFTDIPPYVYPTVGLQTPGEVVDANFGQSPFVFDFKSVRQELQERVENSIENFPLEEACPQWQSIVYKMISSYLVHHGYCATAEAFARSTSQDLEEEITSIKNRQKIQKLVLSGKMGEAIKTVMELYPGLLEDNANLLFLLRVRQFIEIVNGTETHNVCPLFASGSKPPDDVFSIFRNSLTSKSKDKLSVQHTSVIQSTKSVLRSMNNNATDELNVRNVQESQDKFFSQNGTTIRDIVSLASTSNANSIAPSESTDSNSVSTSSTTSSTPQNDSDVDMECAEPNEDNERSRLRDCEQSNGYTNGLQDPCDNKDVQEEEFTEMDVENDSSRKMCGGDPASIENLFYLGRELQKMSQVLKDTGKSNKQNKLMLQNAFSLLAYNDPWRSPVGWQLNISERDAVCQALNSAILESRQLPRRPPIEVSIAHTKQLIKLMARSGFGVCAFANMDCISDSVLPTQDAPLDLVMAPRHQKQQ